MAFMLAVYGKDAAACDEMTEAEFAGYTQNLETVQELPAHFLMKVLAPVLGLKIVGG